MNVYGIDFSGAKDAGNHIWVAAGQKSLGRLVIDYLRPGRELPESGIRREKCHQALVFLAAGAGNAVLGFDFPFSVPRCLFNGSSWEDWVREFPQRFEDPESFKHACWLAAGERELKRVTDTVTKAPFSAYNLRIYYQTYYGVRDVLNPLVAGRLARVLPMQQPERNVASVVEICPASTLKRAQLGTLSYKGKSDQHLEARQQIVAWLEGKRGVIFASPGLRNMALDDPDGDALDAVIAAETAGRVDVHGPAAGSDRMEGCIYL